MWSNFIETYLSHRLVVVPVKIDFVNGKKTKVTPLCSWQHLQYISFGDYYNNEFPKLDFTQVNHVGIVLQSSNLVVFDFDDTKHMPADFVQNAYEVAEKYKLLTVRTGRGMHIYFRRPSDEVLRQIPTRTIKEGGVVEFKSSGLVSAPLYDDDDYYRPIRFFGEGNLVELTLDIVKELQIPLQPAVETHKLNSFLASTRRLDDEKINMIVDLIEPYHIPGQRNEIVFSLAGMLRKLGVSYEDALRIVNLLIERTNDEEPRNRLDAVRRTYTKSLDDADLLGSSGLLRIIGDESVVYQIYQIVKGEPLKFDELFIRLFATTGWWLKQIEDIVKQNYIALTDNEGQVTLVRKFDAEKGAWLKIKDFKDELNVIIKGLMKEWEDLLLNANCDEKTRYGLLYKLFKTQPQREVNEIYASLLQDIKVNAEKFYASPPFSCSVCKDNIINIVACETHFIFVCKCGHIELIEKSAIENPKSLRVFTYIPASLPADPSTAYEFLSGYGKDLMHTLLRVASYVILSRRNFKRKIFVFNGVTSSGKTTFCELLKHAVSLDYHPFAANALTVKGDATHATRASLASHKIATFSELPPTALSNDNFKLLTDVSIPARFLYKNPANFYNISNIIITTNYDINAQSVDAAVVERVVLVCFEKMFYNNREVAQFYIVDEKQKAIEEFAQKLWDNKQFANSFLAAILQAWRDLCNDDFNFQVDQTSKTRQAWLMNETLSVDAFSQLLQLDPEEYYPVAVLFDMYRRYCKLIGVAGVSDERQFGAKLSKTNIGCNAKKKVLRSHQISPSAVIYAGKYDVRIPDQSTAYSLKPSPKLLKLLQIDLSNDNDDNTPTTLPADLFEDDEQIVDETITIAENENETPADIPQTCANCGNEFIRNEDDIVCENCEAIVLLTNPLCVVVEEDKEPEKCVICGEQIKLKEGEKACRKCGTEYDVKLKFLF